jgi:hypothetical protein
MRPRHFIFASVCCLALTNCGAVTESLLVDPSAYAYYRCEDIARALPGKLAREQQLKALIAVAEKESFGVAIAAVAYQDEYVRTQAEIRILAESARERRCEGISVPSAK